MRVPARQMRRFWVTVIATMLLASAGSSAEGEAGGLRAGPLLGSDFRISGRNATANEGGAAVAWNGIDGRYIVVWSDLRFQSTRGSDIYGQFRGGDGAAIGGNFRISDLASIANEGPAAVAWNAARNEYLVVWYDDRSGYGDIYGRRMSAAGKPIGPAFQIAAKWGDAPAVAWNGVADQYLVVWEDGRHSYATGGAAVYGQRISATGSKLGGNFRVSGPNHGSWDDDTYAAVATSENASEYLVVWENWQWFVDHYATYGRRVATSGTLGGDEFSVSGSAAVSWDGPPAVAWNGSSREFLVVWEDWRDLTYEGWQVYGRRVSQAGYPVGNDFRISGPNASDPGFPQVAWNPTTRRYLVVWRDMRHSVSVMGRRVSAAGVPSGNDIRISGTAARLPTGAAIAASPDANEFLVVWEDSRNESTRGTDIYGQRLAG